MEKHCIKTGGIKCRFIYIKMVRLIRQGGGTSQAVLDRIAALESEVSALKQQKAAPETFGLAKISESSAVTDAGSGLVLSAREKNAALDGTLARDILNAKNYLPDILGNIKYRYIAKTITTLHWTDIAKFSVSERTIMFATASLSCPAMSSNGTFGAMISCAGSVSFEIFGQVPLATENQVTVCVSLPLSAIPAGTEIYIRTVVPKENVYIKANIYSNVEFVSA